MGGAGKNIIATTVIFNLKKMYPKDRVIVVTPHQDIWKNNLDIYALEWPENSMKIYRDYIFGHKSKVYALEPYASEDYFYMRKNLADIWCDLYKIDYSITTPNLNLIKSELEAVKKLVKGDKVFLIQTNGGAENQPYPISWSRDLPLHIAEEVCVEMKMKGYRPIHLRRKNQYALENAEFLDLSFRESLCLIQLSDKRLFIDSFAQHAAAALNKPSVVTWVSNPPEVFGHKIHTNLKPIIEMEFRHKIDAFLEEFNIIGNIHECPYSTNDIFSSEEIVKELFM